MKDEVDIFKLAQTALNKAQKLSSNLKCAEIYFGKNDYINIEIEENSIKNSELGSDSGASIRVINSKGSLGFAITNNLSEKAIQRMVENSIKMMNSGTDDPDFKNIPENYSDYPNIKGLIDKNIINFDIEGSMEHVKELIEVCDSDDIAISQSGGFTSSYFKTYIFNTNGLEVQGEGTLCSISSNIIVKDKTSKETAFGYDWQTVRNLKGIDARKTAETALEDGKRNLNRIKIKNMRVPLYLTPNGVISLILSPIAQAINADTFQYKRSFLVDKRGEKLGSELLNMNDNPLIDAGTGSSIFDGEGVPCRNKEIFKAGTFLKNGLLHNSYTAGKEGIESTGNASRKSYSSVPSIGISNLIMEPGQFSNDGMLEEIKQGILLDYTGDSPNTSTGDFSGLILHGNLIVNGEIKESLNETMIGINLLDLFKQIDAVSRQYKIYGPYRAPYVRVKDVQIIGGA